MPGYSIELELSGRTVLVVGLGVVGRRKAAALVEAGARVIGVDPAGNGTEPPPGVEVWAEPYKAEHLRGAVLAFAAATAEVNRRVVADGKEAGVWVNSASDPSAGNFRVPAVWRDGPLTLTVATAGASPALAAALRDRAVAALGPAAGGLAALLAELRPIVLERLNESGDRRRLLSDWADPRWLELFEAEGAEAVRRRLLGDDPAG